MALRERMIYAIEIVGDHATKGLGSIRAAVDDADGSVGKFKAGAGAAFAQIGANAGLMAVSAGGAIAAFGLKAVNAFTDTAKAAIDLSTSTGLGIENASRWIAVADDYQVTAEALATGLGKVAKTLDNEKWSKYGIATRDAAGNARDTNDILLDSFDMLSKVENQTERTRIGQELFGKGYQSLTPLLGHTREEYEKMLGAQKEGQVITEEEARKAEETRLAYDELHDTLGEFTLLVGQKLAPAMANLANTMADTLELAEDLKILDLIEISSQATAVSLLSDGIDKAGGFFKKVFGKEAPEAIKYTTTASDAYVESLEMLTQQLERAQDEELAAIASREANKRQMEDYVSFLEGRHNQVLDQVRQANLEARDAAREHALQIDAVRAAMDRQLSAALNLVGGDIAVRNSQREAAAAAAELNTTLSNQETDLNEAAAAIDNAAQKQLNAAGVAADYRARQMEANGETVNAQVQHQLFKEELERVAGTLTGPLADAVWGYIGDLSQIPTSINTQITMTKPGRVGDTWQLNGPRAAGGPTYPGLHEVLEGGRPELLTMNGKTYLMSAGGGQVTPAAGGAAGAGMTVNIPITVQAGFGVDGFQVGRQVAEIIDQYFRDGGQFSQNTLRLIRGTAG